MIGRAMIAVRDLHYHCRVFKLAMMRLAGMIAIDGKPESREEEYSGDGSLASNPAQSIRHLLTS
ncbi:hypothetical protein [Mycobacterium pseudokansasii]|uniref:hypothetical protein n=1 Tax=Mycobacterium pseudokansasii TaxID=2341080 RepID=UPI001459FEB6|nr:hypothetical protein [Mycobacterium pseudokansasii]